MKSLKLLSKKFVIIIFILFTSFNSHSSDKPIDIWNMDVEKKSQNSQSSIPIDKINNSSSEISIYKKDSSDETLGIIQDTSLDSKTIKITGLYDPEDYDLDINMWSNSDGYQLKNLFRRIAKIDLSDDASELMNISILINAHYPRKNITEKEFLSLKSDWLIKNSNFDLIKDYLNKNAILNDDPKLSKFFIDHYISEFKLEKACDIFSGNSKPITDEYLSKFNLYCLINDGKTEEALLKLDLKKELGFKEKYFENKINYLLGYTKEIDGTISEKSIFDFHLAHKTNPNFEFEPDEKTSKIIWKYLSSANLLSSFKEIEITELDKISNIEKAVHNKNYSEEELFKIYMRFQFSINQLLTANESYKSLSNIEARALLYQKI